MFSLCSWGAFIAVVCGAGCLAAALAACVRRTGRAGWWLKRVAVAALLFIICIALMPSVPDTHDPGTDSELTGPELVAPPAEQTTEAEAPKDSGAEAPPPSKVEETRPDVVHDPIVYVTATGTKYHRDGRCL